jgi:SAM-dependent methyltransferase
MTLIIVDLFIDNIINLLQPAADARFLDLACGKGRHSIYLNKKGFAVTGVDLSPKSIASANEYSLINAQEKNIPLEFYVHDMRKPFRINYFDYVLNMFTSFGYFENSRDDIATIDAIYKALKPDGIFVFDFLNTNKAIANLITEEEQIIEGIKFNINRTVENNFIVKRIVFSDNDKLYHFEERVKVLSLNDIEQLLATKNFRILHTKGDYQLNDFNLHSSNRLIMIAQKK